MPGVRQTTNMTHIKVHYYTSHGHLNHFGIVPQGPNFIGLMEKAIKERRPKVRVESFY